MPTNSKCCHGNSFHPPNIPVKVESIVVPILQMGEVGSWEGGMTHPQPPRQEVAKPVLSWSLHSNLTCLLHSLHPQGLCTGSSLCQKHSPFCSLFPSHTSGYSPSTSLCINQATLSEAFPNSIP